MTAKAQPTKIDYESRKKLGIFYTPVKVTQILTDWAIRSSEDTIFEPSFGGCGFLESSRDKLEKLGNRFPSLQLFGCDIDPEAFNGYLHSKFSDTTIRTRFIQGDFLKKKPEDFTVSKFDIVIGNPPYVSQHNMTAEQKKSCAEIAEQLNCNIGSRASLWAYFVLHSLNFLKKGGRVAWVLPSSFLHTKYAEAIKERISKDFARSIIIQVGQRLFASEGTEESTAILLAEGWKTGNDCRSLKIEFAKTLPELKNTVSAWKDNKFETKDYESRSTYSLLSPEANEILEIIESENRTILLGNSLEILIGIVTGDNRFFVIDQSAANTHKLSDASLTPVFSRFSMAQGLSFSSQDLNKLKQQNFRCLLVDTSKTKKIEPALEDYLKLISESKKVSNVTFKKRKYWHQPNDGRIPLGFFSYMHHQGPRLVINDALITCTNTIHRVFPKKTENGTTLISPKELKLLSISLQTTYSQLSAELEGRVYGSGALKHEPSEVKRIKVLTNPELSERQIERAYIVIDLLFRSSRFEDARRIADKLLFGKLERKLNRQIILTMETALKAARARRYNSKVEETATK